MRRTISIIMALCMVITFSACAKKSESKQADEATTSQVVQSEEQAKEEVQPETEESGSEDADYEEALKELPENVKVGGSSNEMFADQGDDEYFKPLSKSFCVGKSVEYEGNIDDLGLSDTKGVLHYALMSNDETGAALQMVDKYVFANEADAKIYYDYEVNDMGAETEFPEDVIGTVKALRAGSIVYMIRDPRMFEENPNPQDILTYGRYLDFEEVYVTEEGMKMYFETYKKMSEQ